MQLRKIHLFFLRILCAYIVKEHVCAYVSSITKNCLETFVCLHTVKPTFSLSHRE